MSNESHSKLCNFGQFMPTLRAYRVGFPAVYRSYRYIGHKKAKFIGIPLKKVLPGKVPYTVYTGINYYNTVGNPSIGRCRRGGVIRESIFVVKQNFLFLFVDF